MSDATRAASVLPATLIVHLRGVGGGDHAVGLGERRGDWLFDQNVFFRSRGGDGRLRVQRMRQTD